VGGAAVWGASAVKLPHFLAMQFQDPVTTVMNEAFTGNILNCFKGI
jgi:hypothetical protein